VRFQPLEFLSWRAVPFKPAGQATAQPDPGSRYRTNCEINPMNDRDREPGVIWMTEQAAKIQPQFG
jgi:hypothetical protein